MTNFDCNKENVSLIQHVNFNDTQKTSVTSNHAHQQQQQQHVDWVDTVVNCATIMNKIFTRNTCRLCHIYSDKQVEFEERIQQNATITATAAEWYSIQQGAMYNNDFHHDTLYPEQPPQEPMNHVVAPSHSVSPVNTEAIELYRKYLFDEESVVDSIELRIGRSSDDDDEKVVPNDHETDDMKDVQLI